MIILHEHLEMPAQHRFVEDDHMIQTLATNRSDDPLDIPPLLRRSWRAKHFLNAKFFHLLREVRTEDAVAVPQYETRRAVPWKRLPQLLPRPFGRRMSRHGIM